MSAPRIRVPPRATASTCRIRTGCAPEYGPPEALGLILRILRWNRGWSAGELARRGGISSKTIQRRETGVLWESISDVLSSTHFDVYRWLAEALSLLSMAQRQRLRGTDPAFVRLERRLIAAGGLPAQILSALPEHCHPRTVALDDDELQRILRQVASSIWGQFHPPLSLEDCQDAAADGLVAALAGAESIAAYAHFVATKKAKRRAKELRLFEPLSEPDLDRSPKSHSSAKACDAGEPGVVCRPTMELIRANEREQDRMVDLLQQAVDQHRVR